MCAKCGLTTTKKNGNVSKMHRIFNSILSSIFNSILSSILNVNVHRIFNTVYLVVLFFLSRVFTF